MEPRALLQRLDEIGRSLERSGHALALIGLGSVGLERERLDAYSDLDFFVIVELGYGRAYLDNLNWLSRVGPIAYSFQNTGDGYKVLFADGIFCEFAVFEPQQLAQIPFSPGRIVWKQPQVSDEIGRPAKAAEPPAKPDRDWLLGEVLTNLYVGLGRERRGETLAAMRLIQVHAVDRLLDLAALVEVEQSAPRDVFANERRFEQRYPHMVDVLADWAQGYARNRESALSILAFLEQHFGVNQAMAAAIRNT